MLDKAVKQMYYSLAALAPDALPSSAHLSMHPPQGTDDSSVDSKRQQRRRQLVLSLPSELRRCSPRSPLLSSSHRWSRALGISIASCRNDGRTCECMPGAIALRLYPNHSCTALGSP